MFDILFFTHANEKTGFGHASRCSKIAKKLKLERPELKVGFCGDFIDSAKNLIQDTCSPVFTDNLECKIGIYDRMDDTERPEIWDKNYLNMLIDAADECIFFANGLSKPLLPPNVTCIGYKLGKTAHSPPSCFWSLEYAPVEIKENIEAKNAKREQGSILIALGGGVGNDATNKALQAITEIAEVKEVDILLSPVNGCPPSIGLCRKDQVITLHQRVKDITPLLLRASVVLASYGHLGYEALSLGCPLCVVGQKKFQTEFANQLASEKLCISAGSMSELSPQQLSKSIMDTLAKSKELSSKALLGIDGLGIDRITQIILSKLN